MNYNDDILSSPIWDDGGVAQQETVFVLKQKNGEIPPISMAFYADEILSVKNYALDREYVEGKDYILSDGKLKICETGEIPSIPYDEYYFEEHIQDKNWPCSESDGAQLMTEALTDENGIKHFGLTQWQIAVTYRHNACWRGPIPPDKSRWFPRFHKKIIDGETIKIVGLGDSITEGWSASGHSKINIAPNRPPYYEQVVERLRVRYHNVESCNLSVAGMSSPWGAEDRQVQAVIREHPDLLLIAFGMNDGSGNGAISTENFKEIIRKIIDGVRGGCPQCEIITVAPMLPNREVGFSPRNSVLNLQGEYYTVLNELQAEYKGVAVADVTEMFRHLLNTKRFRDMSGNNINHPNDYVHRLYAQVVLKTLTGMV